MDGATSSSVEATRLVVAQVIVAELLIVTQVDATPIVVAQLVVAELLVVTRVEAS